MSKVLKYITKGDGGQIVVVTYYPTEDELTQVRAVLLSQHRPAQIDFRGSVLTTRQVEILDDRVPDDDAWAHFSPFRVDDKQAIVEFEGSIEEWFKTQTPEHRTFDHYAVARGACRFGGAPTLSKDGKERFYQCVEWVLNPRTYSQMTKLWSGLQWLRHSRGVASHRDFVGLVALKSDIGEFGESLRYDGAE